MGRGRIRGVVAFASLVALAGLAAGSAAETRAPAPYRPGPIASAPRTGVAIDWPRRAREAVVLGGIAAILVGFRASGLARSGRRRPVPSRSPLAPPPHRSG